MRNVDKERMGFKRFKGLCAFGNPRNKGKRVKVNYSSLQDFSLMQIKLILSVFRNSFLLDFDIYSDFETFVSG